MKKIIFNVLMSLLLIIGSLLPVNVLAEDEDVEQTDELTESVSEEETDYVQDNISFSLTDGVLTISGSGQMNDYKLLKPAPWYEYKDEVYKLVVQSGVTYLGNYSFYGFDKLVSVELPDTLSGIGSYVFGGCSGLKYIYLPSSVTFAGKYVFYNTGDENVIVYLQKEEIPEGFDESWDKTNYLFNSGVVLNLGFSRDEYSYWTSINDEETVTVNLELGGKRVPSYAFDGLNKLKKAVIPEGAVSLSYKSFNNCNSLETVELPDSLERLSSNAFSGCSSLNSLYVPSTVESVGETVYDEINSDFVFYLGLSKEEADKCYDVNFNLMADGSFAQVKYGYSRYDYIYDTVGIERIVVNYHSNEAEKDEIKTVVIKNKDYYVIENLFKEPDDKTLKFVCWKDSLENRYLPGDGITNINDEVLTVDLYAQYEKKRYTVSFVSIYGDFEPVRVEAGTPVSKPEDPVMESYRFMGWYEDRTYLKEYDFSSPVNSDITLYAKWEKELKRVDIIMNEFVCGNLISTDHELSINGADGIDIITLERIEWEQTDSAVFWPGREYKLYCDISYFDSIYVLSDDFKLYVNGMEAKYLGTEKITTGVKLSYEISISPKDNTLKISSLDISGLVVPRNGKEAVYNDLKIKANGKEDVSLDVSYKWLNFDGSEVDTFIGGVNYIFKAEILIDEKNAGRYSFDKGYYPSDISVNGVKLSALDNLSTGTKTGFSISKGYTARYKDYLINYISDIPLLNNPNPDGLNIGESVKLSPVSYPGYTFSGWYNSDGKNAKKVTSIKANETGETNVYARWSENSYKLSYNLNGGSLKKNEKLSSLTYKTTSSVSVSNITPYRNGYTFMGWSKTKNGDVQYLPGMDISGINENLKSGSTVTLYAVWKINEYSVVLNTKNGSLAKNQSWPVQIDQDNNYAGNYIITDTIKLPALVKEGYKFNGWYSEISSADGTVKYDKNNNPVLKKYSSISKYYTDIELTASFTPISYSISYSLNKGSIVKGSIYDKSYNIETSSLTLPEVYRTGYIFKGWFLDKNLTKEVKGIEDIKNNGLNKVTLYAKWTPIVYNIKFINDEGKEALLMEVSYDKSIKLNNNILSIPGKFVSKWTYTDINGKTKTVSGTSTVKNLTATDGDTVVLTVAKDKKGNELYNKAKYTVKYILPKGAKNASGNPTSYYYDEGSLAIKSPSLKGKTFDCWEIEEDGIKTGTLIPDENGKVSIPKSACANLVLTAVFK